MSLLLKRLSGRIDKDNVGLFPFIGNNVKFSSTTLLSENNLFDRLTGFLQQITKEQMT